MHAWNVCMQTNLHACKFVHMQPNANACNPCPQIWPICMHAFPGYMQMGQMNHAWFTCMPSLEG